MQILLENLKNPSVHRSVKPQIFSVFGDIALAVGVNFKKYLDVVLEMLAQASQTEVDKSDYDMIDYLNTLRESCLEAYTGIIQGLKGEGNVQTSAELQAMQNHVNYMVQFIIRVAADPDHSDSSVAACAGLIGDLCSAFGSNMLSILDVEPVNAVLTQGRRCKVTKTQTLSKWATKGIRKLKNGTAPW